MILQKPTTYTKTQSNTITRIYSFKNDLKAETILSVSTKNEQNELYKCHIYWIALHCAGVQQ